MRIYRGPMRFFGVVMIAPKWPYKLRFDLLMQWRIENKKTPHEAE